MVRVSSGSGLGVVVVEVEVREDGLRMFLNLDLRLKDRGLVTGARVVGSVVKRSLLEDNSLDLVRNKEEFLEKDLVVGLGEVEGSSLEFLKGEGMIKDEIFLLGLRKLLDDKKYISCRHTLVLHCQLAQVLATVSACWRVVRTVS